MSRKRKARGAGRSRGRPSSHTDHRSEDPARRVALAHAKPWTTLKQLIGAEMPVDQILKMIRGYDRRQGIYTLSAIAADLANADGGIVGPEARAWTHDLLVQRVGSSNPLEDAVSRAVAELPLDTAIAHGHVLFLLQFLFIKYGSDGPRPPHGVLAFLMLALNDHIPDWPEESTDLSDTEQVLGSMFFSTIFNQTSDDPLRFVLRITEILGGDAHGAQIGAEDWRRIQIEAFGCSFQEYAERFLVPVFMLSQGWLSRGDAPVLALDAWNRGADADFYRRCFEEASVPLREMTEWVSPVGRSSGLTSLPGVFFRTPFALVEEHAVCLSPWHVRDHASLGTWAKLNRAAKKVLGTGSNQAFMSTFGILFERWCAKIAHEAADRTRFRGRVLTPNAPGSHDEIEDVVLLDRDRVALFSVKSSLVREDTLKAAPSPAPAVEWLKRFLFEEPASAKADGYRGGALMLLDQKIQRIRAGAYAERGIRKNSLVIPVLVCFDNVAENGILYKWVEAECERLGILSARPRVRSLTILTPEDYEAVFALGRKGRSTCDLLLEKTRPAERWGRTDGFLQRCESDGQMLRLPGMEERFHALVARSLARMRESGLFVDDARES